MKLTKISSLVLLGIFTGQGQAVADMNAEQQINLPSIQVEGSNADISSEQTGGYAIKNSRAATKLDLSVKETPQSITVLTREFMDDFGLDTLNDVLNLTPSVYVEQTETDRTYYTSRGFAITNFQVDGLALPTSFDYPLLFGDVDTAIYDRIEVLKGANGLISGLGNPAATVNYVRKRPTDEFQGSIKGLIGSWDRYRGQVDISGSLNDAKTIRGRFVGAYEDKESYLDRYTKTRETVYGVIDFDISKQTVLTIGTSYQKDDPTANLWGALPLVYADGSPIDYDVSANNAPDWTYWTNETLNSFIELKSEFDNGWQTTAQLTREETEYDSKLFYVYGNPALDGSGIYTYPGSFDKEQTNYVADAYASGPFNLAGREHELVVGAQWSKSEQENGQAYAAGSIITLEEMLAGTTAEPVFGAKSDAGGIDAKQKSVYSSVKLNISDALDLIVGSRYIDYELESTAYGVDEQRNADEFIPFIGSTFALTDNLNAYASYTEIFSPQSKKDANFSLLDPMEGSTIEVGLKMAISPKALASISLFKTEQDNVAEAIGVVGSETIYEGTDGIESKGIEIDFSGEVIDGLQILAGYTYVDIENPEGDRARLYIPKQSAKLSSTYSFASLPKWKVGANVKWQSATKDTAVNLEQDSYSVWGAMTSYEMTPKLTATLNIYNIFDEKYYNSFYGGYGQAYHAPSRSAVLSVNYDL